MSVDVSPDGETLIFDLLGDIYQIPIGGGEAYPLTFGRAWDQAPCFSPDGKSVYFVSDRKGAKNFWRLILSDRTVHQVTASDVDIVGTPNWSEDGTHLIAGLREDAEILLHSVDPHNGEMKALERPDGPWLNRETFVRIRPLIQTFSGVQATNGQMYFSEQQFDWDSEIGHTVVKLYSFDPDTQTRTAVTPPDVPYHEYKPRLSHDGRLLSYFRQYTDRRTELRILDIATGSETALIELTNADDASLNATNESQPNYTFTPDDRALIFWHNGKIHRLNLASRSSQIVPFRVEVEREVWTRALPTVKQLSDVGEAQTIRWPTVSRDGQAMAFAAIGYVWIMDPESGAIRRLTRSTDFEYMPAISPDGKSIVFVSFANTKTGYGSGRLMVANVDDGTPRELLAAQNMTYLLPKWSQDGQNIAAIREVESESGVEATFGWTTAVGNEFHVVAPAPSSNEHSSAFNYARFVGFDNTGRNLLFSFPRSGTETVLATASVDGSDIRTLTVGASDIVGISPAPDLSNLVLTRHDRTLWVVPFDKGADQPHMSTTSPGSRPVSDGGGYYVDWNHPTWFTFGFGQQVYRYRLDRGELATFRIKLAFDPPMAVQPIAFIGARLITMSDNGDSERTIESGTIVVDGARIASVGAVGDVVIPSNAIIVDVKGKTIMPGLLDTHYHSIRPNGFSAFALPDPSINDRSAMAYGITTAWEPAGPVNDGSPAIVDLQRSGRIVGPRWSHAAVGGVGSPWEELTNYSAAVAAVEQHNMLGVVVLKEYNTPTRQQRQWLSAAAHKKGLGIIAHTENFDSMMTRVVDGYTGGDHSYIPMPFFKDVRELLKQTSFVWTPNIITTSGSSGSWQDVKGYFWREFLEKRPLESKKLKAVMPSYRDVRAMAEKQFAPYQLHRVARVAEQVAAAAEGGVHIGVSAHDKPGVNLHGELWYLWKGGLSTEDVLRAATIGNAEKLGLQEEIGSLEVGKIADLLVLHENPLEDITNTLSIQYTVQGGIVYDGEMAQRADMNGIRKQGGL